MIRKDEIDDEEILLERYGKADKAHENTNKKKTKEGDRC